jgi:hypothetical protein
MVQLHSNESPGVDSGSAARCDPSLTRLHLEQPW